MLLFKLYDRDRALAYARRYALSRNPLFYDFSDIGGNCTNFVSQCVLAGSCVMNYTKDFGWYYRSPDDRAAAWTGVDFFWQFMTGAPAFLEENGGIGPFGREISRRELAVGDVIQLADRNKRYYHSVLVSGFDGSMPLVAAQSIDSLDRPLGSYTFSYARFLHIEGVRFDGRIFDCFENLIEGLALPPES